MVILTPPPHELRNLSGPVDTSSQLSAPDDTEMVEASLEEVPTTISPIAETPRPSSGTPPADASHLYEKPTRPYRSCWPLSHSIKGHRWKVVWELGMELHQTNSETMESIKEARAICAHATWMLRPSVPQLSRKPRQAAPEPSGKPKPFALPPLGMQRSRAASQADSLQWDMSRPSNTWRNKSSKRKVRVRLTSSLPAKLPYKSAL